ncbi:transcription termination/antitermination protein NusG [Ruegeria sp. HKCCD7255]|uniref:transcription termination/antitermination protein NusG n=1 Tax=Ruegeria sp. HKCCD7255 TaxID=2683004 RepID=UPI00148925E1|nr:transcription termination/antitermination NusG family protein [Ruegeria sp. HKCCD7255]
MTQDRSSSARDHSQWFAAQLRPNMRLIAERNLTRQGFKTFCPTRWETARVGRKLRTKAQPLFPGYLFVGFTPQSARWQVINNTRGVNRLITDARLNPAPIPPDFMTALRARCDAEGVLQPDRGLAPGDTVRIFSGPFSGELSRIEKLDQHQRLQVLIQILGRAVRATVSRDVVERVSRPEPA